MLGKYCPCGNPLVEKSAPDGNSIRRWTPNTFCSIKCRNKAASIASLKITNRTRKPAVIDVQVRRKELGAGS